MDAAAQQVARDAAGRTGPDQTGQHSLQARWHVGLLGGLCLSDGPQRITRLPSRAITALLARLALAPQRAHAREELIELLWPGVALHIGRNRLRQALSSLKSLLEPSGRVAAQPVLVADRSFVRVVPGSLACDAVQFEQHLRAGQFEAARSLYLGELLPGFYDEWIDEERLRLSALHDRLALMTELRPEQHAQPQPESRIDRPLHASPVPTTRVTLPTYLTRMFGADEQGTRLRNMLLAHRLVTLLGPGGAGKTRLAVEVAHSLREHAGWPLPVADPSEPFDLIAFVSLVACTTRAQACDAITGALQIAPGAAEPMLALNDALAGRRALLVLDNFEQLAGQAETLVAGLVGSLPLLHVLVTSRRPLGLDGEHEFAVAALDLPRAGTDADAEPGPAASNAAVALFVERARAVRADFHCGPRNAATLVALVQALGACRTWGTSAAN